MPRRWPTPLARGPNERYRYNFAEWDLKRRSPTLAKLYNSEAGSPTIFVDDCLECQVVGRTSYFDFKPWDWPLGCDKQRVYRSDILEIGYTWLRKPRSARGVTVKTNSCCSSTRLKYGKYTA